MWHFVTNSPIFAFSSPTGDPFPAPSPTLSAAQPPSRSSRSGPALEPPVAGVASAPPCPAHLVVLGHLEHAEEVLRAHAGQVGFPGAGQRAAARGPSGPRALPTLASLLG